jgi:hypothetical protein
MLEGVVVVVVAVMRAAAVEAAVAETLVLRDHSCW